MTPRPQAPAVGRATTIMAVGTALSRVTGVMRIFALAYALGSLGLADSYNLANTIPNIVHDIVLGGIVSATFIPVFVERLSARSEDEAWDAISAVTSVTLIVIAAATVLFYAITPLIISTTTALNNSSGAAQSRHVSLELLLLFVPQLTCYGLISLATALLNARRRFGAPMFTPIANNVVLIVVLLLFGTLVRNRSLSGVASHRGQLLLLGLGTTFGVVAQAVLMIPSLRRAGLKLRWRPDFRDEAVHTILRLSAWTFGLVVTNQIALLVVLVMSEKVGAGAVTAYTYAYTFFQLPYGVVAVSVMAATAPELTALWATGDMSGFRRRMAVGLRAVLAMVIPSAAGLLVLARPLVALLLAHGASTPSDTVRTASSLAMLAIGIPGFCTFLYAVRVLQSLQDLRSAFWLYVVENGINIVFAVALAGPLGVRGIALSISIAYSIAAVLAVIRVRDKAGGIGSQWLLRPLGRVTISCISLVLAAALASNVTASQSGPGLLVRVVLGVGAGGLAYFLTAAVLATFTTRFGGPGPNKGTPRGGGPTGGPGGTGPPLRLPPAGRPPIRPTRLGPTQVPGRQGPAQGPSRQDAVRGRLDP